MGISDQFFFGFPFTFLSITQELCILCRSISPQSSHII